MASNIKKRINLFDDEEVRVIEDENGNKVNNSIDITPFNRNSLGGFYNQNLIIPKRSGVNEDILNQSIRMTLASSNKEEEKKWYEDFFQHAKSFDDGYQFGDVSKTVGGSLLDIVGGIGKGIVSTGENIGDFLSSTVVAGGADLLGKHDYAQQVRENVANKKGHVLSSGIENVQNATDKYSVIGNTSDNINESIGYMASIWATSEIGGAFLGNATIFTSSAGKSVSDSYAKYGTDLDKMAPIWEKAIADGAIETFTENMFGMFGKVDAKVPNIVSGKIKSGLGKMLARTGLSSVGEAAEEFISYGLGAITDRVIDTVNKGSDIKFAEKWDWNQIIEQSVTAALTTIMMGGMGDTKAIIDTKTNNPGLSNTQAINQVARMKDSQSIREDIEDLEAKRKKEGKYSEQGKEIQNEINEKQKQLDQMLSARNFMTDNEQKVYDNIYNIRMTDIQRSKTIDELTKQTQDTLEKSYGRKLTEQEIEDIRRDVENSVNNNTFDMNRTELNDEEKAKIEKDIMDDFRNGNIDMDTIRDALGENIDISKDRLLTSSLYENSQKYVEYIPEFTGNEKIDRLLQSAVNIKMNNTSRTRKMIKTVVTLVENTDRQYRFVNNEQLESDGYNSSANGLIDKKTGEILINVNSTKTLEAVVGHETTHLFDSKVKGKYTQEYKDLQKAVKEFLQDNGTYESKVKEITDTYLKAGYNLTADEVMEEVVADTIGDYLFGEDADAFIAKLSENKTVFQKIYDYIKRLVNKLRGNDIDITPYENLENKFKEVWKTLNTVKDIDTKTKYSMGGFKGLQNMKDSEKQLKLYEQYKEAKKMAKAGKSNAEMWKKTRWIKDATTGELKFYFSDAGLDVIAKNYVVGKEYDLQDMIKHDILFELYPQLRGLKVIVENLNQNNKNNTTTRGGYNRYTNKIRLDYRLFSNQKELEKTLAHEIQHAIQKIENFSRGASTEWGIKFYKKSPGEKEARTTANRMLAEKYKGKDFFEKIPEYANDYISMLDKMKISLYNYLKDLHHGGENNDIEKNVEQNNEENSRYDEFKSVDRRLNNEDNQGRVLSKGMQKWAKESQARTDNGNLVTVYHTMTDRGAQFNEFNPVGTPYYRFGDQVVNYFTDSKDMSGSYADNLYKAADTKKITNMEELNKQLDKLNDEIKDFYVINLEKNKNGSYTVTVNYNYADDKAFGLIDKEIKNLKTNDIQTYNELLNRANSEENPYYMFKNLRNDKVDEFLYKMNNMNPNAYTAGETARLVQQYLKSSNVGTVEFNNQEDLFRNFKEKLQKQLPRIAGSANFQYEGYVNIKNPYIIDAEKRNWNRVVEQSNDFIDDLVKRVPEETKNNLTRLYNESHNISNELIDKQEKFREDLMKIKNPIIFSTDTKNMAELIDTIGIDTINNIYEGKTDFIPNYKWWAISEVLKDADIVGDSVAQIIHDEYRLPEDIKKWLDTEFTKKLDLENASSLKELYEKFEKVKNEINKYPMPYSYFIEQIKNGEVDLGAELEDILETRAEITGPEEVAKELAKAASAAFSKTQMIRLWGNSKTTNDIVQEIIASNKDGKTNYDGVIIKNVYDYGGKSTAKEPANLYVTFNSNQFKAYDNTNPTSDPDIRYSISDLERYETNKQNIYKKLADEFGGGYSYWEANLENTDKESAIRFLKNDERIQDKFIENNNFEKVSKPVEYTRFKDKEMQDFIKTNQIKSLQDLINDDGLIQKYLDLIYGDKNTLTDYAKENYNSWKALFERQKELYSRGQEVLNVFKSFERDINKINSGVTTEIDEYETSKKLKESPEFNEYVESLTQGLFEEKPQLTTEELTELAQDTFGTTTNFDVGAYMTPDGKLLNFNDGGGYREDHREIHSIGYNMQEFIDAGNIRMKPEGNGFELTLEPTQEQYSTLEKYIDSLNGEVYVEIDIGKNQYDGADYKKGTPTNKIIRDLQYYFKNGTFPQQSELAQFRYSLTKGETDQYWKKLDKNNAKEYNTIESEVGNYGNEQVSTENDRLQEDENQQPNAADEERYERVKDLYRDYKKGVGEERARLNDSVVNILSELPISKTKAQKFIRELANNKVMTQQDIQTFLENNNKFKDKEVNEYFQQIRNDINSYSFALDDTIRAELKSKYGNIPRNIKFSNNGMSIDTIYQELSNEYPDIFSPEIKNASDEAIEIIDFMRDIPIMTITEGEIFTTDELAENATNIYAYKQVYEEAKNYYEQRFLDDKRVLNEKIKESKPKKITRKEVSEQLLQDMGITVDDLEVGKDIHPLNYQVTDPVRVNEKVFGNEIGKKFNEVTINKQKHNTAEKTRWLNIERTEIKELGIKARTKESAAVQKYGEKQFVDKNGDVHNYGDIELAQEFPNVKTQEKIKNAAKVIRSKYDSYIDQINDVITSLGYDPIPKRADYMRHFQELGDMFSQTGVPFNLNDMKAEDLPTDINGLTEFNKPGKNWFASSQQRYGNKTTYDAITGIDGYLEGAGNLIFHTEDVQRYRALSALIRDTYGTQKGFNNLEGLTDAQIQKRISDIQSNKLSRYVAWLDEQANNLAGKKGAIDRGVERALGRRGYTFLNTLKKQVGSNMTGFNVRSSLTNFISSTIAAAKTNKLAMVKGTMATINNMFKNDGFINKSDFLTSRFGSNSLSSKVWQKVSNAGQIFMTGSDYLTSNIITRSKYYEGLQKGMTETEAIKYADDFAARVMGDRSQGATAEAFNSKTLGLFTQFQLEVNNQWQYMIHDTKMDFQNNSKINGGLKAGATMLFQMGQLAAFSYFFNEIFEKLTGSRAAFDPIEIFKKLFGLDDEDDEEKSFDQRLAEANSLLIDNIPFGNLITGGGRIPISEAFTGINTLSKKITGQKDKYGNEITWENVKQDTLETLPYWILPSGYGQIKKTSQGLDMYNNKVPGSYTDSGNLRYTVDEDAKSKIQAAIFGAWANPYAQDYIDSGYKTINKNNIDEMVGLGMNSTEYREFKQGMTDVGDKKQDKLDYINGSDLTTEQKNLVANNLDKNSKSKIDMQEYDNYNSYDEYKYARDNPSKYLVITQIDTFDKYNTYKSTISSIKEEYSSSAGYTTAQRKVAVQNYIESLDLSVPQKMMLEYMAGGYSIKGYSNYIQEYLDSTQLTTQEKYDIWEELFN